MAYTITVYDPSTGQTYDISNRTQGLSVNENLDSDVTTFQVSCKDITMVHLFNHITILKDETLFLSGIVINQRDEDGGHLKYKITTFECEDWGHLFQKRVVAETYTKDDSRHGRPDMILKHILSKYAPEFTSNNIDPCSTVIDRIQFPYITIKEAIENIMDLIPDWHWYVDNNKDFHLFSKYETDGVAFTKDNIILKTLRVEYTGQEHVNRVWIVGRKQASPVAIDQYYTGDGIQRYFQLAYEPNETQIYVEGVLKDSSLESNDNGARDFLINKTEKVFYIPQYKTPFSGTIRVNYKPTKQFVDYYENNSDKKKYGLLEKAIKNSDITDKLEARKFGSAEVKRQSVVKRAVSFRSRETNIRLGNRCSVNITSTYWSVQGNFLVKAIKRDITPADEIVNFELEEIV